MFLSSFVYHVLTVGYPPAALQSSLLRLTVFVMCLLVPYIVMCYLAQYDTQILSHHLCLSHLHRLDCYALSLPHLAKRGLRSHFVCRIK